MLMAVDIQAVHCIQWPAALIISQRNPDLGGGNKGVKC